MRMTQVRASFGVLDHAEIPDDPGLEKNMNSSVVALRHAPGPYCLTYRAAYLMLLIWYGTMMFAQTSSGPMNATATTPALGAEVTVTQVSVTQVLGFEAARNNTKGTLSVQDNALQFKKNGNAVAQVNISSIQDVVLGEESKQVGGLPMTLGKAGVPYGGGRVISLFSHKKYDTLTLQYLDANGGLHGAIFQLEKGQAAVLKNELVAKGAHVTTIENPSAKPNPQGAQNDSK